MRFVKKNDVTWTFSTIEQVVRSYGRSAQSFLPSSHSSLLLMKENTIDISNGKYNYIALWFSGYIYYHIISETNNIVIK